MKNWVIIRERRVGLLNEEPVINHQDEWEFHNRIKNDGMEILEQCKKKAMSKLMG